MRPYRDSPPNGLSDVASKAILAGERCWLVRDDGNGGSFKFYLIWDAIWNHFRDGSFHFLQGQSLGQLLTSFRWSAMNLDMHGGNPTEWEVVKDS